MAVGDTVTMHIKFDLPSHDETSKPPHTPKPPKTKPTKPPKPITKFTSSTEYAKSDIEASTPTINPDAVIPSLCGRQRLFSPNVLWFGNYRTKYEKEVREETKTVTERIYLNSGYSEFEDREVLITEKKTVYTPVDFYITVVVGLCHGPHVKLKSIHSDTDVLWAGETGDGRNDITTTLPTSPFKEAIFYSGEFDQEPNPELIDLIGEANVNAMVGTAYLIIPTIASKDYGSGGFSFELERSVHDNELSSDYVNDKGDINAAQMLWDVFLNNWQGLALPSSYMDTASWLNVYNKCITRNYFFSYLDTTGSYGTSYIEMICGLCGFVIFVDPTTEKIVIREFHTDNYDAGIALSFNDDNVVDAQEFERLDWSQMPTHFVIEYSDRANSYKQESIERINYSINQDDQRIGEYKVPLRAMIATEKDVALRLLTRAIMHNGAPIMELDIVTDTSGGQCRPGDAIKLSIDEYGYEDYPFWITDVKNLDNSLNQVALRGFYFNRYNVDDFDDAPDETIWIAPDTSPVKPTIAEIINTEIPPNMLMRQGFTPTFIVTKKKFYPFAMIFVRAENNEQVAVNVHKNDDGAVVKTNMSYCASGFLSETIEANHGQVDGFVGDVEIDDHTYLHIVDNEGGIAYSNGEWFKFKSVTRLPGGRARINKLERGLWGTELKTHTAGSIFWMMDDANRLFGPFKINQQRSFTVIPIAASKTGDYPTDGLQIGPRMIEDNVMVADAPVQIAVNGTRWYVDAIPTIYLDTANKISWQNVYRRSTTLDGILDNVRTREKDKGGQVDQYVAVLHYTDEDDLPATWALGRTGDPDGDVCSQFKFQNLTFTLPNGLWLPGAYSIELEHRIGNATRSRKVTIPFIVEALPGAVADFTFDYAKRFSVDKTFDYEIATAVEEH